jgi:hypothetical protein
MRNVPCHHLPPVSQAATTGPVQLERTVRVGDELAVESERFGRSLGAREINEAVSSVTAV